jgi:hypothetical protein
MKPVPWHSIAKDYAAALKVVVDVIVAGGDAYIEVATLEIRTYQASPDEVKTPPNLIYIEPTHTGMPFFAAHEVAYRIIERRITEFGLDYYTMDNFEVFVAVIKADIRKIAPGTGPNVLKELVRGYVLGGRGFD